jgi:hypothetical protein
MRAPKSGFDQRAFCASVRLPSGAIHSLWLAKKAWLLAKKCEGGPHSARSATAMSMGLRMNGRISYEPLPGAIMPMRMGASASASNAAQWGQV